MAIGCYTRAEPRVTREPASCCAIGLDTPPPSPTEHGPPALAHARVADGTADCHTSESADEYAGKCPNARILASVGALSRTRTHRRTHRRTKQSAEHGTGDNEGAATRAAETHLQPLDGRE